LTGLQNYIYFSGLKGVFGFQAEVQAEKLLRQFDLWKLRNKKVETYSFGMKQRLAIACSMSHNPSILLFDEPSSGLDTESIEILQEYICRLSQDNKTIVLSSHDEKFISRSCTRKLIVHTGCIKNAD
jgi:sodium transport system ATP-binding protein